MTFKDRRAARVLLIDEAGRALLFHGGDPARPGPSWWVTPGGGLEAEESHAEGAARELFEETGLRVEPAELGEPIFEEVTEFSFGGQAYRQAQQFFLFRVREWQVDTAGFDAEERLTIDQHRWWSAAEIDATDEVIYPSGLAELLRKWVPPRSAPSADPFSDAPSAETFRGGHSADSTRSAPSADPFRSAPFADPTGDAPSAEPIRSAPSTDPFGGGSSANAVRGARSADSFAGQPSAGSVAGSLAAGPVAGSLAAGPVAGVPSADPFRGAPGGGL